MTDAELDIWDELLKVCLKSADHCGTRTVVVLESLFTLVKELP